MFSLFLSEGSFCGSHCGFGFVVLGSVDTFLTSAVPTSDQIQENAAGSTFTSQLAASESHANESPVLSALMNFNTDAQITFLKILKATGNKEKGKENSLCLHVEEHLLFSMNTSAGLGQDNTERNSGRGDFFCRHLN